MKAIKYLIALLLMAVPAMAQIDNTTLQDAVSYQWTAATITPGSYTTVFRGYSTADGAKRYFLRAFQSGSDNDGKSYHYIFGTTTSGHRFYTDPIDTRGYRKYFIYSMTTNAGHRSTMGAVVVGATATQISFSMMQSPWPADEVTYVSSVGNTNLSGHGLALFASTNFGSGKLAAVNSVAHSQVINFPTFNSRGWASGDLSGVARLSFFVVKGASTMPLVYG